MKCFSQCLKLQVFRSLQTVFFLKELLHFLESSFFFSFFVDVLLVVIFSGVLIYLCLAFICVAVIFLKNGMNVSSL